MTKFKELCTAFGQAQQGFLGYKHDCHQISIELVKEIKNYFKIPTSYLSLYRILNDREFEMVTPELVNALTLREDSYWEFGIGLTISSLPETLPQEVILIQILIRKNAEGKYYGKYDDEVQEFELIKDDLETFHKFFDFLHETIIKSYNEQLPHFIDQSTKRKLGFELQPI